MSALYSFFIILKSELVIIQLDNFHFSLSFTGQFVCGRIKFSLEPELQRVYSVVIDAPGYHRFYVRHNGREELFSFSEVDTFFV